MITRTIAAGASAVLLAGGIAWTALASGSSGVGAAPDTSWPVAAAPGAARESAQAARAGGSEVIRVREIQSRGRFIDLGRQGETPGDYFIFESKLMLDGDQVGRDSVRCLMGLRTFTCDGSFLLTGRGKIVISGSLFTGQGDFRLPVTGGTAAFKDARGELTVEENEKSTFLVFDLLPR